MSPTYGIYKTIFQVRSSYEHNEVHPWGVFEQWMCRSESLMNDLFKTIFQLLYGLSEVHLSGELKIEYAAYHIASSLWPERMAQCSVSPRPQQWTCILESSPVSLKYSLFKIILPVKLFYRIEALSRRRMAWASVSQETWTMNMQSQCFTSFPNK